jgi:hypothetical protein
VSKAAASAAVLFSSRRGYGYITFPSGRTLMILMLTGIAVMIVAGATLWLLLPRGGKVHRFVNTEWEPYVGVALTSAVALGFTMILSGAINIASAQ